MGDPHGEVDLAWSCYQQLRAIYAGTACLLERRALAEKVIASFPSCPVPEVARLGRTLRGWRAQVPAYFATDELSNGGTKAINMLIDKARRLAHGYRNFENYRLQMLLAGSGTRTRRARTASMCGAGNLDCLGLLTIRSRTTHHLAEGRSGPFSGGVNPVYQAVGEDALAATTGSLWLQTRRSDP